LAAPTPSPGLDSLPVVMATPPGGSETCGWVLRVVALGIHAWRSGRSAGARTTHLHPPGHDIQPWLRPVRWNPAPCRQHTLWRNPASRREDVARLGGNTPAMPRRTLGHAVPASRGKRPLKAPTQVWSWHPCIIDRAIGSVEGSSPWWLSERVEADDRAGQHGQRVEAFRAALVADAQPPEAAKPGPVRSILQRWRPSRAEDLIMRRAIRGRMPRRRR
jgi:hypothetical protein